MRPPLCVSCAVNEASHVAQRRAVAEDVVPTMDMLLAALAHQRSIIDAMVSSQHRREEEHLRALESKQMELDDANGEIKDLTDQLSAMTDTMGRLQPTLLQAGYYRRALAETQTTLSRIRTEVSANGSHHFGSEL